MATSYAKHGFNDLTYARLLEYTSSPAVVLRLIHGYASNLLQGWASGRNMFITLRDAAGNVEVCKITDIQGDNLTVARGQDGTVARNWPAGTLVAQRSVADTLGRVIQKGEYRTIGYNPNGVLAASYPGEKVYETGPNSCQVRWWLNNGGTKWRLLAGEKCDWEFYDGDGYVNPPTFWEPWDGAICDNNNWNSIRYEINLGVRVSENCNISAPPFPAGLWDLSGGSLKHDWTNNDASQYARTWIRSSDVGTVENITKCLIDIAATATYGSVNPDYQTQLWLMIGSSGGFNYWTIACLDQCPNYLGPGYHEIDLASYGISGYLQYVELRAYISKQGARLQYDLSYIGVY